MKSSWIKIGMGCADILDSAAEDEEIEASLEEKFQHLTSLMEGGGRVNVKRLDPLRIDVSLGFIVQGHSVTGVMEKFKADFQALAVQTQGIEIGVARNYKLCYPTVNGEQFSVFVRVDPESGKPIYTED